MFLKKPAIFASCNFWVNCEFCELTKNRPAKGKDKEASSQEDGTKEGREEREEGRSGGKEGSMFVIFFQVAPDPMFVIKILKPDFLKQLSEVAFFSAWSSFVSSDHIHHFRCLF